MNVLSVSRREYRILDLLINTGEMFGLQLVNEAPAELPRGTVYVTLQRMTKKGLVASRLVADPAGGPARRMYRATGRGYRMYMALRHEASELAGGRRQ
jgi:PadR family transcriptional regulator, regulatory protein PadR